jgi:hypothetical protein
MHHSASASALENHQRRQTAPLGKYVWGFYVSNIQSLEINQLIKRQHYFFELNFDGRHA